MRLTLPIREVIRATPRAAIVRLDLDGGRLDYAAGQAVLVGSHGGDVQRPYSISSAPEETAATGTIELLVGVGADGVAGPHLPLTPGALADVEGPLGTFTFPADPIERRFVFVAGGTGIAPLRAMLRHALAIPHGTVGLFYSARTPDDFAYEAELRALAARGDIELRQTITRGGDADWHGLRGRIDRAALAPFVHDPATLCFVCGPRALVEEVPKLLTELGIARERIRTEEW